MSDAILIPTTKGRAARVVFPLALPLAERAAWLKKLTPADLAAAESVPYDEPAPALSPDPE